MTMLEKAEEALSKVGTFAPRSEMVRAVLAAIREPDEAMIKAGYDVDCWATQEGPPEALQNARDVFAAMIDAILAEKP